MQQIKEYNHRSYFLCRKGKIMKFRLPTKTEYPVIQNNYRISSVLEAGLEPAQPQWPRDFKSLVSTDSTIRASFGAENETRTRDPNLGKVVLYQLSYFRKLCPKKDGCKDKQFPLDSQTFQTHFFQNDQAR